MSSTPYTNVALGTIIPFPYRAKLRTAAKAAWLSRFDSGLGAFERLIDFIAVVVAVIASYRLTAVWRTSSEAGYSREIVGAVAVACGLLAVLLLEKYGDYSPCLSLLAVRETERLLRVTVWGLLLALFVASATGNHVPRAASGLAAMLVPLSLALEKWPMQKLLAGLRRSAGLTRTAVIVGTSATARRIYSALVRSPKLGIDPVAFVDTRAEEQETVIFESSYRRDRQARVLADPITPRLLRRLGATVVILADAEMDANERDAIRREADQAGAITYVLPDPFAEEENSTEYVELDGVMLAYQPVSSERPWFETAKRTLDLGLATISVILLSPLMVAAALTVKWTSPGPVIFRQKRVGRGGRHFEMFKFRTMHAESARYACSPLSGDDPRITRVGRFLRHTCIDEIPQLINVLRGEMSLVGPRPEMPFIVEKYEATHLKRLAVKPGITGLWQLSGDRLAPIHENISYDLYYVQNRSVLIDVAILLHTAVFAFRGV